MKCLICGEEAPPLALELFRDFTPAENGLVRHLNQKHRYDKELPPEIIEVPCFGTRNFKFTAERGLDRRVWIFHEGLSEWQLYPRMGKHLTEYFDLCLVCHKPMWVSAIPGTTWLACCSEECFDKYRADRDKRNCPVCGSSDIHIVRS